MAITKQVRAYQTQICIALLKALRSHSDSCGTCNGSGLKDGQTCGDCSGSGVADCGGCACDDTGAFTEEAAPSRSSGGSGSSGVGGPPVTTPIEV